MDKIPQFEEKSWNNIEHIELLVRTIFDKNAKLNDPEDQTNKFLINLLYASCITVLESFLQDSFKSFLLNINDKLVKYSILEENGLSKSEKENIYLTHSLDAGKLKKISDKIDKISFHEIDKVKKLYSTYLDITLPSEIDTFKTHVLNRHTIFHNGGENPKKKVEITLVELLDMIESTRDLMEKVTYETYDLQKKEKLTFQ